MLHSHINSENLLLFHLALGRIPFLSCHEKIYLFKNLESTCKKALLSSINNNNPKEPTENSCESSKIDENQLFEKLLAKIESISLKDIEVILNRKRAIRASWDGKENLRMAGISLHYCKTLNIQLLLYSDLEYPEILRQISDPPYLLFCRGNVNVLSEKSVSVVGTRRISQNGKMAARQFAYDAVIDGCNVISGLANGADGCAHEGAVSAYFDYMEQNKDIGELGKTIAVLPSAIDEIVPGSHKKLAAQILQSGGLLISEYEPKMPIANWHFVGRNRIIAGLSPAVVVIEAPAGSGALITADFALENGRDVMFHQVSFEGSAKFIAEKVKKDLEFQSAEGKVSKYKVENTPEKYLDSGAPVIKDYKDYCVALAEIPGKRSGIPVQGELFK